MVQEVDLFESLAWLPDRVYILSKKIWVIVYHSLIFRRAKINAFVKSFNNLSFRASRLRQSTGCDGWTAESEKSFWSNTLKTQDFSLRSKWHIHQNWLFTIPLRLAPDYWALILRCAKIYLEKRLNNRSKEFLFGQQPILIWLDCNPRSRYEFRYFSIN